MKSTPREPIQGGHRVVTVHFRLGRRPRLRTLSVFRNLTVHPSVLSIHVPVRRLPNLLVCCQLALRFFSNLAIGVGPPIYSPAASGASTIWTHVAV
jgi:hypothetical protein